MSIIKIKLAQPVKFNRALSTLRLAGGELVEHSSVNTSQLYIFEGFSSIDNVLLFSKIGTRSSFLIPVQSADFNAGGGYYEIKTDLFSKPQNLTGLEKVKVKLSEAMPNFKYNYKAKMHDYNPLTNRLDARSNCIKKVLNLSELVSVRCKQTGLPVYYDGKNIKTWRNIRDVTYGISKSKVIPANEMVNYEFNKNELIQEYNLKYGAYNATLHAVTFKLTKQLSEWHRKQFVSSCMLNIDVTTARLKTFYKFYRRSGFKIAIIRDCNGVIIGRALVDSKGYYTRIYSLTSAVDSKMVSALDAIGLTKTSDYSGVFYAIKKDDNLLVPYIDGQRQKFNTLTEHELKNGKTLVECEFNSCGEFEGTSTVFEVSIDDRTTCDCCGERYDSEREGTVTENGQSICQSCYDRDYFYCEECDETCHNDNQTRFIYESRNGDLVESWCCESCADNMQTVPFRRN